MVEKIISSEKTGKAGPRAGGPTLETSHWFMDTHLVSFLGSYTVEVEYYRRLRHMLEDGSRTGGARVIAVTSPIGGDGKTLTSINLAGVMAQGSEASVLLMELDLRQPGKGVTDYLGVRRQVVSGVVDVVQRHSATFDEAVHSLSDSSLHLMPAGRPASAPYEVVKSRALADVLEEARQRYDYVVVDTAPVALVPDSQLISRWVDGFLMVVAAGKTPRGLLEEALNSMDSKTVLGLVFNGCSPASHKYYGYYS